MTPQELKSSILQLAIQGKLVEQRPEEGTGEELYQEIQSEKQKLIKTGIIKADKSSPKISEDEIPFDVPESWKWVYLETLCSVITDGTHKTPSYTDNGVHFLSVKDISSGYLDFSNAKYISEHEHRQLTRRCKPEKGDVLVCRIGTLGKALAIDIETEFSIFVSLGLIKPIQKQTAKYIETVINSGYGYSWIQRVKVGGGTHTFKINLDDLREFTLPLPPLAEQKRIVAKIEELLPYIDRYEKAWSRLEEFNKRFPVDMQKSILQMAIQGKLVEQRPEEGTGEELFQQIQAEKQKLIKEGKIKKEKPLPEISENDIPFDIPVSWKWAYLLDIIEERPVNGYSPKGVDYVTEIRNLTLTATTSGRFKADAFKYVDIPQSDAAKYWLKKGDLLVQRSNSRELVGTSCIYTGTDNAFIYPDLMMRMRVMNGIYVKYIDYVLKSPMVRSYYMVSASGTSESMPKINQKTVSLTPIPLPPLAEQKRIVAKLEEILPFCEKLKSK